MNRTEELNTNSTLIKNIHYFLQNGDKEIKYSPNKDIVLLLGNTGSGKSTLTQYISGNAHTLWSQEVEEGSGQFVIIDKKNKISSNSTLVSQTIYPDLIEDAKSKILYYDCPGFSDTRSAAHEIAATYFIKKVIDSARSVKMVFVVSHNSVTKGEDRQHFILMLQHATDFVKQIEKFKNSIALVVTKIENRYVGNKIVSDEKVIKAIGNYLEQAKLDIGQHPEMVTSPGQSSETKEKVLSLLDIFLSRQEKEQYTRIGIFRKPNEPGLISEIELMKEGKIPLENLINKNIRFAEAGDKDFGYTVSAKSKVHISALAEEINKTIVKELLNIGKEIEEYCIAQEEKTSDLEYMSTKFQKLQESFSKVQVNAVKDTITPEKFISEIDVNIKYFEISIPDHHIKTVQREGDYINFLNIISNQSIKSHKSSLLAAGLSKLTEYLSDSHSFYHVLNAMYQRLEEFDVQKNRNKYSTIHVNEFSDLFESSLFKEVETILKENSDFRKMKLDRPKLKLLNTVLDQTLKYQIEQTIPEINTIMVKGMNVKLSDLSELLSNKDIKFIEVYALHKIFIDTSLDLTGREMQMAIIAPVWEVVGGQSIILDGKPGMEHYSQKARSGEQYGESGYDGQPGEPGGPAGNFIGIGKHYINEEYMHISANGGKGGRGQNGGDGADGYDGAHCPKNCVAEKGSLFTVIYNKDDEEYMGGKGGKGGDGGIGGYGGSQGSIYITKVGGESGVVQAKKNAQDGDPGGNGTGGRGGKGGRYFHYKIRNYVGFIQFENFEPINKWAEDGQSGKDGTNLEERENTWKLTKFINISKTKTEYQNYSLNNMNNTLKEKFLTTFLSEIDNNQTSITQPTNRKRRNIINLTDIIKAEEELRKTNKYKHVPIEIQPQSYDQYVGEGKDTYYLHLYPHLDDSIDISKPVSSNSFFETESAKQIPLKPIFPILKQLENMKTEKDINIIDQYSSTNLHGNLLLAEIALKKLMGKEIPPSHSHKDSPKEGASSAHDLAYSHYLAN
ncbi:uncharacterized protein [Halyomorpha halys]|uniref:uncharacterized protein n=1 Tax=Halyomorpha halys TaxID=286706 RepID=UPI0006D4D8CF|nr:uncharacterized protein LOC106677054 [Halyomorpha halys]